MTTITSKAFLDNPAYFFDLALKEDIAVKKGKSIVYITMKTENISPSGDPYWGDQRNIDDLNRQLDGVHSGEIKCAPLDSEKLKIRMGI